MLTTVDRRMSSNNKIKLHFSLECMYCGEPNGKDTSEATGESNGFSPFVEILEVIITYFTSDVSLFWLVDKLVESFRKFFCFDLFRSATFALCVFCSIEKL